MKDIKTFIDQNGFVCELDDEYKLECGDALHKTATLLFIELFFLVESLKKANILTALNKIIEHIRVFKQKLDLVTLTSPFELVRHPDSSKWFGQRGTCSMDQLRPVLFSMALVGPVSQSAQKISKNILYNLFKRFGFAWNTKHIGKTDGWKIPDLIGPSDLAVALRCFMPANSILRILYKQLLSVLDIFLLFNTLVQAIYSHFDKQETSSHLNLTLAIIAANTTQQTLVSKLCKHALTLKSIAKSNTDRSNLTEKQKKIISSFDNYFEHEKAPPINDIILPIIQNVWS